MFSRARVAAIALGLALASGAHAQPVSNDPSAAEGVESAKPEPAANTEPSLAPAIQDLVERIARALESTNAKVEETAADKERARRDLRAQEAMAKWAFWMFVASLAGVIFTAVGIWLVWLNLREARKVTSHSLRSADAAMAIVSVTEKSARDALVAARKAAFRQMRAYVYVKSVQRVGPHQPQMTFKITTANSGNTPAVDARVSVTFEVGTRETEPTTRFEKQQGYASVSPHAEHSFLLEMRNPITPDDWAAIETGSASLFLHGFVSYGTIRGESAKTRFRYSYGRGSGADGVLNVCRAGNHMQ